MNNATPFEDFAFASDPNIIDFMVRKNEGFLSFARDNPNIVLTELIAGRYIVGYSPESYIETVMQKLGTGYISSMPYVMGLLGRSELESAGVIQMQQQPFLDLNGRGVLVGLVDTGIDYTNNAFIYEDGTSKIVSIYDQSVLGNPPEGFLFGTEYTNEQINEALRAENPLEVVPHEDTSGHGTFLASIAAGREQEDNIGAAPQAELIIVKARKARPYYLDKYLIPEDIEYAYETSTVMVGVNYIVQKAAQLNRPVSIFLGLGTNQGSHDGFSIFEEYLTSVSNRAGHCITLAAGNESQERHHTQGGIAAAGQSANIEVKVENICDVYINLINSAADRLSVSITSPTGEVVGRVPAKSGTVFETNLVLERARVAVEYYFPVEGSSGQATIIKIRDATPGIWIITVYGDIILDGTFNAYLHIDGLSPGGLEFLKPVPNNTIVVPATSIGIIATGAYDSSNNRLYSNSSWGPTNLPRMSPDIVAPGVNVSGIYPLGPGTMSGTSVAAAITAGASALMLQWGVIDNNDVSISTYQIRAFLIRGAIRDTKLNYPNPQWGYGRLNLINSYNMMREI
ncbi:MAG TPA: S8 family peptidase [Clostridia bacterium]|nr:S8 family peptidase [Clostridia bacterium]